MSLSSSFRLFSPKLPLSNPFSKPICKNTPFLSPQFQQPPSSLSSKPHLKTSISSSSSSPISLSSHPIDDLPPKLQSIVRLFQSVKDSRSKYEQLLFYGRNLPPLDARFKTSENKVQGCVSQVWVRAFLDADRNVLFEADSDSALTKGLAALLVEGLSGLPAAEIACVPRDVGQMLGLKQTLTPSRNNGFLNMLILMQKRALELDAGGPGSVNEGVSWGLNSGGFSMQKAVDNADSGVEYDALKDTEMNLNLNGEVHTHSSDSGGVGEIESNFVVGRAERMKEILEKELCPVKLVVEDTSHQHSGHAGVRGSDGETHFNLKIVSKEFEGKSLVKRHRIVYDLLQDELRSGLHALSIVAKTPSEEAGGI